MEINKQAYDAYVKEVTPVHNKWLSIVKAFLVGGAICTIGQLVSTWFMNSGMDKDTAASWTLLVLIAGSVILTGLNIYPKIVKFGGAGALVPITGFANSMVSPALEFKSEGFITGLGAKLFTVAGPVLVYGITASVVYGLVLFGLGLL